VVEYDALVRKERIRRKQVAQSSHDACRCQIAFRIIVSPYDENAGMMAFQVNHQQMQIQEVLVVSGDNHPIVRCCISEVNGVVVAGMPNVRRDLHVMACLPQ